MSSILIKDIEMPKERESFTVTIKYNGLVFDTETGIQVAEAQEIPTHGRLIDADALGEFPYNMDFCDGYEADEWVRNAPTIIEAEEGET